MLIQASSYYSARRFCLSILAAVGFAVIGWPGLAMAADTIPPTTPTNFQATVTSDEAVVTLKWGVSTDAGGVRAYQLERTVDQINWLILADSITVLTYQDKTAGFGVHYFYRIAAVDVAGNVSAWATTDATTGGDSQPNDAVPVGGGEFSSSDGVVTVQVPAGAAKTQLSCTVTSKDTVEPKLTGQKVIAGPYNLVCRTAGGDTITEFKEAVTWLFNLEGKVKNLKSPEAHTHSSGGRLTLVENLKYEASTKILTAPMWTNESLVVMGTVPRGISLNLIVVLLVVALVVVAIVLLVARQRKKISYDEYMRSKYYDL